MFRLEYEQKRDVGSRITKLESTLSNLKNALKEVEKSQIELKSAMEAANSDIDRLKEEVLGTSKFNFYSKLLLTIELIVRARSLIV